jgi:hypothetical protein
LLLWAIHNSDTSLCGLSVPATAFRHAELQWWWDVHQVIFSTNVHRVLARWLLSLLSRFGAISPTDCRIYDFISLNLVLFCSIIVPLGVLCSKVHHGPNIPWARRQCCWALSYPQAPAGGSHCFWNEEHMPAVLRMFTSQCKWWCISLNSSWSRITR